MVEIPIQRKERRHVWPFVLLVLIIVAVVAWYLYTRPSVSDTTPANRPATSSAPAPIPTLALSAPFLLEVYHGA